MRPIPKFIAVIHCTEYDTHNITQVGIALTNGAGGVFLIDHNRSYVHLVTTYTLVRSQFPDAWIGLNFLDLRRDHAVETMAAAPGVDALWIDDAGIHARVESTALSGLLADDYSDRPWGVFASVAFKYQGACPDEEGVALSASELHEVVVTSGEATGSAPRTEKLSRMKAAMKPGVPLALASGTTIDNVGEFLPYVDIFMVATGISASFHKLDSQKVKALAEVINQNGTHYAAPA